MDHHVCIHTGQPSWMLGFGPLVIKTLRLHGLHNFEYFHIRVFPHTTLQGLDDSGDPALNQGPSDLIMINKQETSSG